MDIIIAGTGKVGFALARKLVSEGHDITLIDNNSLVLEEATEQFDVMAVCGNCASLDTLVTAGIKSADLLIAMTDADELNLLCCMTAHGINSGIHTIARIRNPAYAEQIATMPEVFPLSMTVNPEKEAAVEIQRLLKYPGFLRRDTFAKGLAEIVELRVEESSPLCNVPLMELSGIVKCRVLVCAVLRSGNAIAPKGDFILQKGDRIFVTAPTDTLALLLKNLGIITRRVRKVLICGGGRVSYYLAELLESDSMSIKLIDRDLTRCTELAELLPKTSVLHGDCSNQTLLDKQRVDQMDALCSLTGMDETNMVISLHGNARKVPQIITKLSRGESAIADTLPLGSIICPKDLTCNAIVRYVRAMQNQTGAAVSIHTIADGQVEAVEFLVDSNTKNRGVPLKQLKLKPNILLANITHGMQTQIPGGDSTFDEGDTVVVVTSGRGALKSINDIFA